jgi:type IV secretory pathway TraG/TraD family ATPase VirD4
MADEKKIEELKQQLGMLYQAAANALLSKQQHDACQAAAQSLMDNLEACGKCEAPPEEPSSES